jgi:hypothetical protein
MTVFTDLSYFTHIFPKAAIPLPYSLLFATSHDQESHPHREMLIKDGADLKVQAI